VEAAGVETKAPSGRAKWNQQFGPGFLPHCPSLVRVAARASRTEYCEVLRGPDYGNLNAVTRKAAIWPLVTGLAGQN
jgi:hypothetical protein